MQALALDREAVFLPVVELDALIDVVDAIAALGHHCRAGLVIQQRADLRQLLLRHADAIVLDLNLQQITVELPPVDARWIEA